jgi:hypothetical protein
MQETRSTLVWEYKPEAFEIIAKKNACPILKAKNNHSYPVNVDIAGGGGYLLKHPPLSPARRGFKKCPC